MSGLEGVQVLSLSLGFVMGQSLAAAAQLGVSDALADGPLEIDELAAATHSHGPSLARLMRTLASGGIVVEVGDGRYANSPLGDTLRSDVDGSVRDAVIWVSDQMHYGTCGELAETVRTGTLAFDRCYGLSYFEHLAKDPAAGRVWDRGMACFSALEDAPIARAYPFRPGSRVVDIGGGQGGFLAEVLRTDPTLHGVLFDLPDVVATPNRLLNAALDGRFTTAGGDFFEAVPSGDDVYVYKRILHDWDDDHCTALLRRCREAIPPDGTLLVVDAVIPPGADPHPAKIVDIVMMGILAGRERTEDELRTLLDAAGFRLERVIPTHSMLAITEATPV